ncbi:alpha/beta fold hydrolase [Allorhizocola rhizosphaerae]|uniref:alpha/beta fold hydrolase n=1 Tax=Allorhizocola rhizosphaerae TaxID=1872709 RepID=UPI000E3CA97B|nr:alpha/beta hydrolase [Allorhizocola rhizosphaerae]
MNGGHDLRWPPPPDGFPRRFGKPRNSAPSTGKPSPPTLPTEVVAAPHGVKLERLITGVGEPVTVFAHGLGHGIAETRPLGSGVRGKRVFFQFRGHGDSGSPPGEWDYGDLARDVRAMADMTGATHALGVSLGAGALCRLLAETPDRFAKVVFFLPAVLDRPRPDAARAKLADLLEAINSGDVTAVANAVVDEIPPSLRNGSSGWAYVRQRINNLMNTGLSTGLLTLPDQIPVPNKELLKAVTAEALVIGCLGDDLHPSSVAVELAEVLPDATLHIYNRPSVLWHERLDLRERVSTFLNS